MAKSRTKAQAPREPEPTPVSGPEPLSTGGQWIGWGVWGSFVLVGFCFGVWAGTPKSGAKQPIEVADAGTPKTDTLVKPEPPKVEPPKPVVTPPAPKLEPPKVEPKKVEPKVEPMVTEPPPEPKKVEPKKEEPKVEPVADVSFAKDIKPIFISKCLVCHEGAKAKAGIDVTSVAAIMKGGKKGPILAVGDLKGSSIWTSVEANEMPPDDSGKPPLTNAEKKLLKDWVLGGAKP